MTGHPRSSIIVSVYTDYTSLQLIFDCLRTQTVSDFEIIVSEDGENPDIRKTVDANTDTDTPIQHLTQPDMGFRKNIALNRAIRASRAEHLIFIDGDCLPHPAFIEAHQAYASRGTTCTGRRLEIGERLSSSIRDGTFKLERLTNPILYFTSMFTLHRDNAKNIECGIYSRFLHRLTEHRRIRLLGCNFSCHKQDLVRINGFNEDYLAAGIGEDSDIDWRLRAAGIDIKNVKFSAIQYHLYHKRLYSPSSENSNILKRTKDNNQYICINGLNKDR